LCTRLSLFEYFLFAATEREIKIVRKMEMATEIEIGKEMKKGGDGDS
jgi:hypothetical protein